MLCHSYASVSSALPNRRPTRTRCAASAGSLDRLTTPAPIRSRISGRKYRRRWRGRPIRSRKKLVAHRYKTETKQNKQMQIVRYSSFCCHFFLVHAHTRTHITPTPSPHQNENPKHAHNRILSPLPPRLWEAGELLPMSRSRRSN